MQVKTGKIDYMRSMPTLIQALNQVHVSKHLLE